MDARAGTGPLVVGNNRLAPLVVVVGQTASGKSALAMELAQKFNGELVCADAWTVRRSVDIGTSKPTKEDQMIVPHHLLDVVGPDEEFTAAVFKDLAVGAINDIVSRGKLPIMVGGTGLYVDSVLYDYKFLPAGNRQEREALNAKSPEELLQAVHAQGFDTADIDVHNKRRLIRLLETAGAKAEKSPMRQNTLVIGIRMSKEKLTERIAQRVDAMFSAGLEAEVQALVREFGWDCEALKGIGYREWREYFDGAQTRGEVRQQIIKSTIGLAKRQATWFKRNPSIHWVDNPRDAVETVTTFLNK